MYVGFLDDRRQSLLGRAARLQERREVAAAAQLRDLERNAASPRLPQTLAVAVAAVLPIATALAVGRPAQVVDVHRHQALDDVGDQVAKEILVGPLLDQLGQCNACLGHRGVLQVNV